MKKDVYNEMDMNFLVWPNMPCKIEVLIPHSAK